MNPAAWIRKFYAWHWVLPWGARRALVITPDSMGISMVVIVILLITTYFLFPALLQPEGRLIAGVIFVTLLLTPLYMWQFMLVSAERTVVWRALFLLPYWFNRIPPHVEPRPYEGDECEEAGITFACGANDVVVGNGWNAQALFDTWHRCRDRLRAARGNVIA